jgi:hypothetical protein
MMMMMTVHFNFFPKHVFFGLFEVCSSSQQKARARKRDERRVGERAHPHSSFQNPHVIVIVMHSIASSNLSSTERGVSIAQRECSRLKFRSREFTTALQKRPFKAGKTTTTTTLSMREDRRARSILGGESSSSSSSNSLARNNENRRPKLLRRSVEEKDEENNNDTSSEEKEESEEVLFDKALSKKLTTMPIPSAERKQNILLRTLTAVAITCAAIIPQISERPPTPALSVGTARTSTLVVGATKSVLEDAGLKKETDRKRSSWYAGTINL